MIRLAGILERYGEAVEYDLAVRGIDVGDLWRRRRWRKLLNLIDHLPRSSYFVEAQANDEELAERVARAPLPDVPSGPRVSEWSPEVAALADMIDRLTALYQVTFMVGGGKPPKIPPYQRPVTALDRVRTRVRREKHHALVARVLR